VRLTAARAREAFDYDPLTGLLTWRINPGPILCFKGKVAGTTTKKGYVLIGIDYAWTGGPGSDIRASDAACSKWEARMD
jgi:hypothetical protein